MSVQTILQKAHEALTPIAEKLESRKPEWLDAEVSVANFLDAVQALRETGLVYLAGITGLDLGVEAGEIEVIYHFYSETPAVVNVRLRTPRDNAKVPTVCDLIPSATFFERELMEMLGVIVEGTPNPDKLFLPDDWPDGVYPLRKDFTGRETQA